ncbi:MAG: hypothetical protein ACLFPQ_01930 [Candidatus Woesearchaeota archaeon]
MTFLDEINTKKWSTPSWYLYGIIILNFVLFIAYFISLKTKSILFQGLLGFFNLFISLGWLGVSIYLLINFIKKKYPAVNLVFPVYYVVAGIYMLIMFYLSWFKGIYLSADTGDFVTFFTTVFEMGFATLFIYVKNYDKKKSITESPKKTSDKKKKSSTAKKKKSSKRSGK